MRGLGKERGVVSLVLRRGGGVGGGGRVVYGGALCEVCRRTAPLWGGGL